MLSLQEQLPVCPRLGHESHRVMRDGRYGSPPRQRFRCVGAFLDPDTGKRRLFHRFTPPMPRLMAAEGTCDTCDSAVATHAGPVTPRTYGFPIREVAAAFVAVGTGASYARAADRARAATGRPRMGGDRGGALVAEWLDLLAPVVLEQYAETTWPETLLLDKTWFMVENPATGTVQQAFAVLGAYGYPAASGEGPARPRLWGLWATPRATARDWEEFLRSLDTSIPPRLVVSDGELAIQTAVRAVWPELPGPSLPMPFLYRCEYHLIENGKQAMGRDNIHGHASFMRQELVGAFHSTVRWENLNQQAIGYRSTQQWLGALARQNIGHQVAVRNLLPGHRTSAALDTPLGRIRDFIDSRAFVLRNRRRTNLALGLMRLHLNGSDIERDYVTALRIHASRNDGLLPAQRNHKDAGAGSKTPRSQRVSASLRA